MMVIGKAIDQYFDKKHHLPGVVVWHSSKSHPVSVPWRKHLAPLIKGYKNVLEETPTFAILFPGSPWTDTDTPGRPVLLAKYGNPVIVVHLELDEVHIKWESGSDLILKKDRVVIQGSEDVSVDLSGAHILRLDGTVEKLPENLSFHQIEERLKGDKTDH